MRCAPCGAGRTDPRARAQTSRCLPPLGPSRSFGDEVANCTARRVRQQQTAHAAVWEHTSFRAGTNQRPSPRREHRPWPSWHGQDAVSRAPCGCMPPFPLCACNCNARCAHSRWFVLQQVREIYVAAVMKYLESSTSCALRSKSGSRLGTQQDISLAVPPPSNSCNAGRGIIADGISVTQANRRKEKQRRS